MYLEWWRAYEHFVRPHESLPVRLEQPLECGGKRQPLRYRQRTPALAAGLTNRRWTVQELLALPAPPAPDRGRSRAPGPQGGGQRYRMRVRTSAKPASWAIGIIHDIR
jgi:hypothetical protein